MLIALEGSSPTTSGENNYKYYVWQAYQETKQTPKIYVPGPATFSMSGSDINIRKMADKARGLISGNAGQIFLVGWSRGAAACIQVAHDLKGSDKKIAAMFLFDAVDRDTSTNSDLNFIPDTVTNAYHAIATNKNWFWGKVFKTVGKTAAPGVNLEKREFNLSHGEIAGSGDNIAGSAMARLWMWERLTREGVI